MTAIQTNQQKQQFLMTMKQRKMMIMQCIGK